MKVLITGASSGLGLALAEVFHDNGHDLVLSGRKRLPNFARSQHIYGDLREPATLMKFEGIGVDVFVNCAGVYPGKQGFRQCNTRGIAEVIAVNLTAPMQLLRVIWPVSLLVNINSLAGKVPNELEAAYCASKHGLRAFSESLRAGGLSTLDVYLGAVRTPMTRTRPNYEQLMDPMEVARTVYAASMPGNGHRVSEITIVRAK